MPRRKIPEELKNPDYLKQFVEQVFKLNKERGWGSRKIGKFLGFNHMFIYRILSYETPEKAYQELYEKYILKESKKKREEFEKKLAEGVEKAQEIEESELDELEEKYEDKLAKASVKRILTELTKTVTRMSVDNLKRIIEQGLMVENAYEEIIKEREEQLKKIAAEERLKRELINEALVYYLAGKLDKERFARLLLATHLM